MYLRSLGYAVHTIPMNSFYKHLTAAGFQELLNFETWIKNYFKYFKRQSCMTVNINDKHSRTNMLQPAALLVVADVLNFVVGASDAVEVDTVVHTALKVVADAEDVTLSVKLLTNVMVVGEND